MYNTNTMTRSLTFAIVQLLLLLPLLLEATDAVQINSCFQQSRCIRYGFTKTETNCGNAGDCEIRVCLGFDYSRDACIKKTTDEVTHVCTHDDSNECLFDGSLRLVAGVPDQAAYCVTVKRGDPAIFLIKDGNGACGEDSGMPLPPGAPAGTTCGPSGDQNYDGITGTSADSVKSCSVKKNNGKECVWSVPTDWIPASCSTTTSGGGSGATSGNNTAPTTGKEDDDEEEETGGSGGGESGGGGGGGDNNVPPMVQGDPHFRTWHGNRYSYHGACDMILMQNPKLDLEVHIRTKHHGQFSYIMTAAVRIGNDVLEITAKDKMFFLNKQQLSMKEPHFTFAGYYVSYKEPTPKHTAFLIHLQDGQILVVKSYREFVSVAVEHATERDFGDSAGMMGNFFSGKLLGRDGKTEYSLTEGLHSFATEWQVNTDDELLFQSLRMPQWPQQCQPPAVTKRRRRLGEVVTQSAAEKACRHVAEYDFDFCVFDVMAMNDVMAVEAYI